MFAFSASLPVGARAVGTSPRAARMRRMRTVQRPAARRAPAVMATASPVSGQDVRIRLYGNNIPITDSLRDYVDMKISKIIRKHANLCSKVDVHLSVEHNPAISAKNAAEVVIFSGKTILRRQTRAADSTSIVAGRRWAKC
jgi:ribosomal subunit interface protein